MEISRIVVLHDGADLDALSSALAYLKLRPDSFLLKPSLLSKRASQVFKDFKNLFRITDSLPEKFDLVLVDSHEVPSSIDKKRIRKIIVYDHHPGANAKEFSGKIERTGSATTLLVEELIREGVKLSPQEATVISLGIYEDTGNLTFQGTTSRDLKALSWLLEHGADLKTVRKYIHESYTKEQIRVVEKILSSLEKIYLGDLKVVIATAILKEYEPDINALLYEVRDLKEADAFFVIVEAENKTYVFGRSQCREINAGDVLSKLGGGGHPEAGSVKLENVSAERVKTILRRILVKESTEGARIGDLMTTPPFSLDESLSVEEALQELSSRGFANAPVTDEEGKVLGIISKKALLKLVKDFGRKPVRDFVNRDVTVLSPEDPVWSAEEVLAKFGQKMIPVVEGDRLVGVITRLDILHSLREELLHLKAYKKKVKLSEHVESIAREVGEIAQKMGTKAYLVGGVVRDILMGRKVWDIDFVVEGPAIELAREVAKQHGVDCHPFEEFGTAHLKIGDLKVEFATTRRESYPSPGAYPVVEPSSLKEDLIRRDFTINAMAVSVNPDNFGTLIDYFGGYRDIKEKLIRVIHPVSFIEDPVRILRALRFAGRLDFNLSKNTSSLLQQAVSAGMLRKAPRGRIANEVRLALREERLIDILHLYKRFRVLEEIVEGFSWKESLIQDLEELKKVIDWHSLEFPGERIDYGWVYLMVILSTVKIETGERFLRDVSAPSWTRDNICHIFRKYQLIERLKKASAPSEIYSVLKGIHISVLLILMTSPEIREKVKIFIERLRNFKLSVEEIKKLKEKGLKGKELGREIERLKAKEMDRAFSVIMERS